MRYIFSVLMNELPGYVLFAGIFMPMTLLLLLLIAYIKTELSEVEKELAMTPDPTEQLLNYLWQRLEKPGQKNRNKKRRAFQRTWGHRKQA